ncbi:hypothetical protein F5Y15DRAFT_410564 [Xylariaceae sp. FL0016]|nr:hypothetical protein F5Y15DRAFT_410564 [Xylariaceae sp. FL0016]
MSILELGSLTRWNEIRKQNRLIDQGSGVHLNRQAVNLARNEIMHHGAEAIGGIVHKVSKRSLRSQRSHDSSEIGHPRIELEDINPQGPSGRGLDHQHGHHTPTVHHELDCVMSQTVQEESEEVASMGGGSDDDYRSSRSQEQAPRKASKAGATLVFGGSGDHAIDVNSHDSPYGLLAVKVQQADVDFGRYLKEHGAHMHASKVQAADVNFGHQYVEHGSHMQTSRVQPADVNLGHFELEHGAHANESKVQPADVDIGDHEREHGSHMGTSKVQPADVSFEDINLAEGNDSQGKKSAWWSLKGQLKKD